MNIPERERDIIEKAIYFPLLLTVLNRDLSAVEKSSFKLKKPYIQLIKETISTIQKEFSAVKQYMHRHNIKVQRVKTDDVFTTYLFLYKGYEEHHNYFNPRLRNKVEELLYLYLRKKPLKKGGKKPPLTTH